MIMRSIFNRTPLPPNQLCTLPPGAIKPEGWLKERLDREARRIEEDLEGYFPGATGESAWLGGPSRDIEGDARALCSLILIAFLSEREPLKQVVGTFVDHLVASQREDGDFGPEHLTDWWPRMLMLRVLRQYVLATRAKEPLKLMDRFFRFQLEALPDRPLVGKSCSRAAENMLAALWLYNITGQPHLLRLCRLLSVQSLNWTDELHIFPHIRDTARMRPWAALQKALKREGDLDGTNQRVNAREFYLTRAEDVAVGLRSPGVINLFKSGFKEMSAFGVGWPRYMKGHGVSLGMFTGDLHLAGPDPARGVDLNALAETLHSIDVLLGTGDTFDPALGDLFEKLALNAPRGAGVRPELIRVNHIGSTENYNAPRDAYESKKRPLDLADGIAAAYTAGLWYAAEEEGLAAVSYAPCTLLCGGGQVRVGGGQLSLSPRPDYRGDPLSPALPHTCASQAGRTRPSSPCPTGTDAAAGRDRLPAPQMVGQFPDPHRVLGTAPVDPLGAPLGGGGIRAPPHGPGPLRRAVPGLGPGGGRAHEGRKFRKGAGESRPHRGMGGAAAHRP